MMIINIRTNIILTRGIVD